MFSPRGYIYVKHILFRELNEKKHNILAGKYQTTADLSRYDKTM
jgi:hypothetical protein